MTSHLDQRSARWLTSPPPAAPSPWKDNVFTYRLTYAPSNMIVNGEIIYWYAPGSTVYPRGGRQHHHTTFPSHADVCCSCARHAASLTRYAWCTDLIPCKNMTAEQVRVGESYKHDWKTFSYEHFTNGVLSFFFLFSGASNHWCGGLLRPPHPEPSMAISPSVCTSQGW